MNTAYSNILAIEETRRLAQELQDKNLQLESKRETLESQALELKRTADRVRQQNIEMELQSAKVEEANKLKSQFLSNMSHELRTPLNSIMALSKVLLIQGKDKLNGEELDYIRIVSRNGEKLLMLINDILDLSKIEAGKIDLHPRRLSVKRIINMIMENLEQSAEEKGIELRANFASELPDIMSDESRVYQIFQNIIGNAVKFTEEGRVFISAGVDERHVRVIIEDTGIGIDEKDLPHIFEEFRQLDGTLSRKYEGTGLGLAIAVKSAELISGSISVESKRGGGSRFEVLLPVEWHGRLQEQVGDNGTFSPDPGSQNGGDTHPEWVLRGNEYPDKQYREPNPSGSSLPLIAVIEDDPDNRTTIRAILKDRYRVIEASEGKTGIEIVYRHRPDLVLLDIALPGISGFTVVKDIKSNFLTRNIPVIALTALSMRGDRERILEAGCDDYLAKPYGVEQLLGKIQFHLETRNEHDPRY
jgi:signal transduction histidine kinase/ActR/RegA family two-component response regulator